LQTHQPEHPVMRALAAGDREAFYSSEIDLREKSQYPPFGRLAALVVSGADKHEAQAHARRLAQAAPAGGRRAVLGPAEAPLALIRGRYRFRLLVKSPRGFDLSAYLREMDVGCSKAQGQDRARGRCGPAELLVGPLLINLSWQIGGATHSVHMWPRCRDLGIVSFEFQARSEARLVAGKALLAGTT